MLVRKKSQVSGKISQMELPVTKAQMSEFMSNGRRMVQDIFPQLTSEQREFLLTGITPEEWARHFPPEKEE